MRNALAYAGKTQRRIVSAWVGTAFAQDDAAAARKQWRQVADQACVLQGGRIIAAGDVRRVLDDETVIREYLGQVYDA